MLKISLVYYLPKNCMIPVGLIPQSGGLLRLIYDYNFSNIINAKPVLTLFSSSAHFIV